MHRFSIIFSGMLALLTTDTHAQASVCDFSSAIQLASEMNDTFSLDGTALAIGSVDGVIFEQYFGDYNAATVVPLASASKLLTGVLFSKLAQDNVLDLEVPITAYLDNLPIDKASMTLSQMLSHTAGFAPNRELNNPRGARILAARNNLSLAQAAETIICCEDLIATPGSQFAYGGASMHLAGHIASSISGMSYGRLFQQQIADPLGMRNTNFQGLGATTNFRPSGGMQSTLHDYSAVLGMLLQAHIGRSNFLNTESIANLTQSRTHNLPVYSAPPQASDSIQYGLGTWLEHQDQPLIISSPGAFGFTPWVDFENGYFGVVMVEDRNTRLADAIREIQTAVGNTVQQPECAINFNSNALPVPTLSKLNRLLLIMGIFLLLIYRIK